MTRKAIYILSLVLFILFTACNKKTNTQTQNILSVDLKENKFSLPTLFDKIELIPLETKDESLITSIGRIIEYNDRYYILDDRISILFCFDQKGNFLYKIDKNGNGPEDYYLIYEITIDQNRDLIYMLSPMGFIHIYDINGNFIEKHLLPAGGGEQDMIQLDNNTLAYWTLMGDQTKNKVTFYDIDKKEITGGFWKDTEETFMTNMCIDVFYKYKGENYFSTQFANEVYRFNKDTVELAYKWDFGENNINLKPYKKMVKEDPNIFSKLTETMEIPYYFYRQFQNKEYYYTVLTTWSIDKWCNIFYRKKDGVSFVFNTLEGGAKIKNTNIFTDDYMISVISPEDIESYKNIISTDEYNKIKNIGEDNNLCLVKFYFKKL
nr:6-bladed beta-propeller [Parabacteroides goldsteinii]